ncbi:MAG: diaminobutyrate decarboxylase, partial [Sphaerochaetaceae bacterium]|nr:diaminobutyrate decarboxylase [Sphaerochaetaceae bacterium]
SKVEEEILPHLLRTWSPRYMPHLHAPALTETIASELLIASFNDSMDSWDQGPAATEVEEFVIHGLLELFDFGKSRGYGGASISEYGPDGTFTSGGSQSNISAIIAARDWYCQSSLNWDVKGKGLPPSYNKLRLYTSEISHFSMDKACHILGLGYDAVRKIPVDSLCKVDINAFEEMVASDVKEGLLPFCAVATLGTTDFGSIDNIEAMRVVCDKYGMHLHGDGAYGGALSMSSKYYNRLGKVSLLDSLTVDFHKMFLFPISCSVVLFKEGKKLDCFELHADYLNREEDEEEGYINLVGKSFQTTRRFDALKVLMAFQTRGKTGMASFIEKNLDTATYFYNCLHNDDAFIAPVKPELSSVVFALKGGDEVNKAVRKALLSQGTVIGQTVFDNKVMLKFTLLNPNIGKEQIDGIIEEIKVLGHCKH